jgi:CubicO group peptidase (beta-lactamase class C family)
LHSIERMRYRDETFDRHRPVRQMVIDVTGMPFPHYMLGAVLEPFGMKESTFEQPLPVDQATLTASAHDRRRSVLKGRWHIYPEMAAAGLWTTPSDLARFAIGLQQAATGRSAKVLSRETARRMLAVEKDGYGLGVELEGTGTALRFGHGGRDEGFDARLTAFAETGQGAVIMINTNDNSRMVSRILEAIARRVSVARSSGAFSFGAPAGSGRRSQADRMHRPL